MNNLVRVCEKCDGVGETTFWVCERCGGQGYTPVLKDPLHTYQSWRKNTIRITRDVQGRPVFRSYSPTGHPTFDVLIEPEDLIKKPVLAEIPDYEET